MTNKEIVLKFYEEVFNAWDVSALDRYMKDDYRQHNPEVADGKEGFRKFCEGFFKGKPVMEIVKIAEDGDMVFVFFKCTIGGTSLNKICDIYRLEDGMLAEHWDVCQHIPEDLVSANENGLF
ncbi:MAG: nuclear transport factor 2 family protein [Lachnospiraceae bacterium]|nr:nuclear transport factor 2 family protein [Lachnospiraceae bacterium]